MGLDKVLRKLEITLTQMISRHQKLTELLKEDEDAKSTSLDHSVPAKATTRIKLPKSVFSNLMETFSTGGHLGAVRDLDSQQT